MLKRSSTFAAPFFYAWAEITVSIFSDENMSSSIESHVGDNFSILLAADQMEVLSGTSLQGNEISHADVSILEGHTSEVYVIWNSVTFTSLRDLEMSKSRHYVLESIP